MDDNNNSVLLVAISIFVTFVSLMMYYYWQGDKLFKALALRYPKYYKKVGEPLYFSDPLSNMWAGLFLTLLILRGIPKDFPNDEEIRRMADKSRKMGLLLLLILLASMSMIFYQILKQ